MKTFKANVLDHLKGSFQNQNCYFKKYFIYLFLDRGEGREKEGEKHQGVVAS